MTLMCPLYLAPLSLYIAKRAGSSWVHYLYIFNNNSPDITETNHRFASMFEPAITSLEFFRNLKLYLVYLVSH